MVPRSRLAEGQLIGIPIEASWWLDERPWIDEGFASGGNFFDFLADAVEVEGHVVVEGNHASSCFGVAQDFGLDVWVVEMFGKEDDAGP